jgi:hypothetical protein
MAIFTLDKYFVSNSIRSFVSDINPFDVNKISTFGEEYIITIVLDSSVGISPFENVDINFIFSSNTNIETTSNFPFNTTINSPISTVSGNINVTSSTTSAQLYIDIRLPNVAEFSKWFDEQMALPFNNNLLDKNNVNNPTLFDNQFPSHHNEVKNIRIAVKYETNPTEYFNLPFASKFLNQNFANALPDISFITDNITVNGQPSATLSSATNDSIVRMQFNMISETVPTDCNLQVYHINSANGNNPSIVSSQYTNSFIPLGGNNWQCQFTVPHTDIDPLNEYRLVYVVYDTANDLFNSFPIQKFSDGNPPSPSTKFTHNWGVPNDVTNGNDTQKIQTVINQRIGSNLRFDLDMYSSLGITSIADYFTDLRILDKQGNILRTWSVTQPLPIDLASISQVGKLNFSFVYRVPLEWIGNAEEINWELYFDFPHGVEKWTFKAEVEVDNLKDDIIFKDLKGNELNFLCLEDLPEIIQVFAPNNTTNDNNIAFVETGTEWYGVIDENKDNIIPNSFPNSPYNWGIFAFDDPYIFDVAYSAVNGTSFKFRLKQYIDDFGLNAIQGKFFGMINFPT